MGEKKLNQVQRDVLFSSPGRNTRFWYNVVCARVCLCNSNFLTSRQKLLGQYWSIFTRNGYLADFYTFKSLYFWLPYLKSRLRWSTCEKGFKKDRLPKSNLVTQIWSDFQLSIEKYRVYTNIKIQLKSYTFFVLHVYLWPRVKMYYFCSILETVNCRGFTANTCKCFKGQRLCL